MDDPANIARDIAAVACTNKELRQLAPSLWKKLGDLLEPGGEDPETPEWQGAPPRMRHEKRFMEEFSSWTMYPVGQYELAVVADEENVPDFVPFRVFAEVQRLRAVGVAGEWAAPCGS